MGSLVMGQVLSLLMALMSVISKVLVQSYSTSTPALQNAVGYGLTCAVFLLPFSVQIYSSDIPLQYEWHKRVSALFVIAIADSQASFLGNLAFRHGVSVASVGILSSFTIPCVMVLSYLFLNVRYSFSHIVGISFALLGIVGVFVADGTPAKSSSDEVFLSNDAIYGDMLVLAAAAVYAISNVFSEGFVKTQSISEYLVFLGFFGLIISTTQFVMFELPTRKTLAEFTSKVEASLAAYAVIFTLVYYLTAKFLERYDAVSFNLSILTTGFWGVVFGYGIFREGILLMKIGGFVSVVIGISLYHWSETTRPPSRLLREQTPLIRV